MKVLTWNIWKGTHFDEVIQELRHHDADILCLQEVKKGDTNQAEEIAERLGYNYAFQQVFTTDRHTPTFTQCNAILAKEEISNTHEIILSDKKDYKKNSSTEPRGALKVTIGDLIIICTHLGFSHDLSATNLQKKQLDVLLKSSVAEQRCILAGDFNSPPRSRIIQSIEEKMTNTDRSNTPTRNAQKKGESEARIDYIFVTKDIQFESFQIHNTSASDHNIITVEIKM